MRFGQNHERVEAFIRSLLSIEWFSRVGQPTEYDENLRRIDLDFVLANSDEPLKLWGGLLVTAEMAFERAILDNARLSEQSAVLKAAAPEYGVHGDAMLARVVERYPGYYGGTYTYAYELIDTSPVERIVRGAACEIMVADIAPSLDFFQGLMPWIRRGHWPYGWEGEWPQGKLILW
jgi:hypothetical protein